MKCPSRANEFYLLNPSEAKRLGRRVKLRDDWEEVKELVMYEICYHKFNQNPDIKRMLLNTGDAELIEGNTWGDCIWGVCNGVGNNLLGKILMRVRNELKENILRDDWMKNLGYSVCYFDNTQCIQHLMKCDECPEIEERKARMIKQWAIVTDNGEKARDTLLSIMEMFSGISATINRSSKNEMFIGFPDGTTIQWWRINQYLQMMRCNKLWCDKEIDKMLFENVVKPNYFGRTQDIIWI